MKITFFCPKPEAPSGGVWFIHKIVGLLREMGKEAIVMQTHPFDCWWAANPIDKHWIKYHTPMYVYNGVVVFPETMIHNAKKIAGNAPKRTLCFLQNYIWCSGLPEDMETIVCSRFLANYTKRNYPPQSALYKLTPYLEEDVWHTTDKIKNKVVLFARRNRYYKFVSEELEKNGYVVDLITKQLSQHEVSDHLADAEFYVHLTSPEGFPMACLEAMRSKTLVVGTPGGGGNEFMFHRETAYCVQDPKLGDYPDTETDFGNRIVAEINAVRDGKKTDYQRVVDNAYEWSLRYNAQSTRNELESIGF